MHSKSWYGVICSDWYLETNCILFITQFHIYLLTANLAKANLSPMQLYNWIFDFYLHTLSDVCAINIFNVDYSPNILTYIYVASINSFFIFFLVMLGNNDIVSILQCASCMNFCLQVSIIKRNILYSSNAVGFFFFGLGNGQICNALLLRWRHS